MRNTFVRVLVAGAVMSAVLPGAAPAAASSAAPNPTAETPHCALRIDPVRAEAVSSVTGPLQCYPFQGDVLAAVLGRSDLAGRSDFTVAEVSRLIEGDSDFSAAASQTVIGVDYMDAGFQGASLTWYIDAPGCNAGSTFYAAEVPAQWNDAISSSMVRSACTQYQHFEHGSFEGEAVDCAPLCASMGDMNDQTSTESWSTPSTGAIVDSEEPAIVDPYDAPGTYDARVLTAFLNPPVADYGGGVRRVAIRTSGGICPEEVCGDRGTPLPGRLEPSEVLGQVLGTAANYSYTVASTGAVSLRSGLEPPVTIAGPEDMAGVALLSGQPASSSDQLSWKGRQMSYFVRSTQSAMSWAADLATAGAPTAFRLPVIGLGVTVAQGRAGAVHLVRNGEIIYTMTAPVALDAHGVPVRATLYADGQSIVLAVAHRVLPYAYPIHVDPYVLRGNKKKSDYTYVADDDVITLQYCDGSCVVEGRFDIKAFTQHVTGGTSDAWSYYYKVDYRFGPAFSIAEQYQCRVNRPRRSDPTCESQDASAEGPEPFTWVAQYAAYDFNPTVTGRFRYFGRDCGSTRYAQVRNYYYFPDYGVSIKDEWGDDGFGYRFWDTVRDKNDNCRSKLRAATGTGR